MKICVIMQEVQTLGGIQRVVTTMLNELVRNDKFILYIIAPINKKNYCLFYIDKEIRQINELDFGIPESFLNNILIKLNRRIRLFGHNIFSKYLNEAYFPREKIRSMQKFIRDEEIDVLIGAGVNRSILAAKIAKGLDVKCIAWMHSTYYGYFGQPLKEGFGLRNLFNEYSVEFDSLIVLTDYDKEVFSKNLKRYSKTPFVLHNPITVQPNLPKKKEKNKILFVGRLNKKTKGVEFLIPVMKKVLDKIPDVTLDIIGDGEDFEYLENQIASNNLENHISLRGAINYVEDYYQEASLLISTSHVEGFGLVITEAFAFGLPVVSFENTGPREIINHGINGYLVPHYNLELFANYIIELLSDEKKWKDFSIRAIERSKDFSLEVAINKFISNLETINSEK